MKSEIAVYFTVAQILACLWTGTAFGQDQDVLSLSSAVGIALENNRQLKAAGFDRGAAEREKREAFGALLPQLALSSAASRLESDRFDISLTRAGFAGTTYTNKFQVSQLIFDRSVLGNIRLAGLRYEAAQWQETGREQSVVFSTVSAFLEALQAEELLAVQKQRLALAEKQLHVAKANFEVGFRISADVSRAELARSSADRDVVSAGISVARAQVVLNRVLGIPVDTRHKLEGQYLTTYNPSSEIEIHLRPRHEIYSISEENNPSVQVANILVRQSEEGVNIAKGEFFPRLTAGASWGYFDSQKLSFEVEEWSVQAALEVPIFEGGRRIAKVGRTKKQLEAEQMRYEDTVQNVHSLAEESILLLEEEKRNLETALEAVTVAVKNHELYLNLYEGGMVGTLDVTQALTELIEAQTTLVTTRFGYLRVFAQLLFALGTIPTDANLYAQSAWLRTIEY